MYKYAHSSSTVSSKTGSLSTPYAPRTSMARVSSDYPGSLHRTMNWKKTYFSLSDPHLTHYFQNKLLASFDRESSSRPSSSLSTPRSKLTAATGDIQRRPASQSGKSDCNYKITIRTGASRDAGTSARVYVTLRGSKGELKRRRLTRGGRREFSFAPGSLERFRIRGKDVGELKQITIESEGLKLADAWYVESLTVLNDEGKKWYCPCNQWLSLHHKDCQLSRTLKAKQYQAKLLPDSDQVLMSYTIEIHTGNVRGGGTCANVFVTLTGSKGNSSKTLIKSEEEGKSGFDRGSVVVSRLQSADVGRVKSLTVEHDNSGFGPDWFLDKIIVYRTENPHKKAYFQCRQWLSRTEGDGAIQRVLLASPQAPPLEACVEKTYLVSTQTGHQRGAGTDANVFVTLYGSLGSSGERRLDNHPANFERGRKDTFSIQCCNLGQLKKVKVRHDNSGSGPSWLLDSVEVKEYQGAGRTGGTEGVWHFPCGRWLEVCDGCGGKLEVELEVGGQTEVESEVEKEKGLHPYKLEVLTGACPGAGTNANVYVILHSRDNHTGKIWLDNGHRTFLPGQKDRFDVKTPLSVSPVEAVTIGHDNSGPSPGWFLDKVDVTCLTSGMTWDLPCGRWLCMDSGDGRIERELHPLATAGPILEGEGLDKWEIKVWTSDIRGAGTDANVTIQVHCRNDSSQPIPLGDSVANFEQGECDTFRDVCIPITVGDVIESVTVSHDNTNPYPDWHLDKLTLANHFTGAKYLATCGKWLSVDNRDSGASVNLKVTAQHSSPNNNDHRNSLPSQPLSQGTHINRLQHTPLKSPSIENSRQKGNAAKNVTISEPVQSQNSPAHVQSGAGLHPVGVDSEGYDGDDFESESDEGESEVDIDVSGERSDVEADRHGAVFGDTHELDSSITNEYLRQLRYEQMSSIDSSRAAHSPSQAAPSPLASTKAVSPSTLQSAPAKTIPYTIHVISGAPPAVKPTPYLVVTMVGTQGHTHPIKLEPVDRRGNYSTESNVGTETFSIEAADIGSVTAIKVKLEGSLTSPPWLVNEINIYSPTSGHTHHFPWGRGIQPGKKLTIERADQILGSSLNTSTLASSPRNGSTTPGLIAYEVKVFTADKKYAGTNNNLHLIIVGDKSSSKNFKMKNSSRDPKLQRGQTDSFNVATSNLLGDIKGIKIAHCARHAPKSSTEQGRQRKGSNSEMDEKWYLFQVVLVRLSDRKKYYFLCRKWIAASESTKSLKYTDVPLKKTE